MIYAGRAPARALAKANARHTCPDCQFFAYHGSHQQTVQIGRVLHHPLCPRLGKGSGTTLVGGMLDFFSPPPKKVARVGADVTAKGAELVSALQDAVEQLETDITMDACGDNYGPMCKGTSPAVDALESTLASMEASGKTLDAKSILGAAGVDATPSNVSAFAKCVKQREDKTAGVARGTLAYCALSVRDSLNPDNPLLPKSHTTQAWRDRWETFRATFQRFAQKYADESNSALGNVPSDTEVAAQLKQYSQYRSEFIDQGGQTTAPSIGTPWSITTWAIVIGAVGVAGLIAVKVLIKKLGG